MGVPRRLRRGGEDFVSSRFYCVLVYEMDCLLNRKVISVIVLEKYCILI